jgi:hypothetical protein
MPAYRSFCGDPDIGQMPIDSGADFCLNYLA